jgi:Phosphotransferase enzyme family
MNRDVDERWREVAARTRAVQGWSLRPVALLGRPRDDRSSWLAEGDPGEVIVKLSANPFAPERARFDLSNVLTRDGVITGIVDWDHIGLGSRALDLTSLLFDWQRPQFADESALAPDGGERLVRRIVRIAGEPGLRSTVA